MPSDAVYQLQRCECDLVDLGAPLVTGRFAVLFGAAVDQGGARFAQSNCPHHWAAGRESSGTIFLVAIDAKRTRAGGIFNC